MEIRDSVSVKPRRILRSNPICPPLLKNAAGFQPQPDTDLLRSSHLPTLSFSPSRVFEFSPRPQPAGFFLVSLSNLMSRENERISCENLEKYGGGYFRNLTSFERFAAEILSFSPTSACFLLIHAVRFEIDAYERKEFSCRSVSKKPRRSAECFLTIYV